MASDSFAERVLAEITLIRLKLSEIDNRTHYLNNSIEVLSRQFRTVQQADKNSQTVNKTKEMATNTESNEIPNENDRTRNPPIEVKQAERIRKLTMDMFTCIRPRTFAVNDTVLAGIVMTQNNNYSDLKLISMTTGTRCVYTGNLSLEGSSLNDMHAEVMSRRCLIKFFYDQLELVANSEGQESIFELRENRKGYKLKSGIRFHLYINKIPCGRGVKVSIVNRSLTGTIPVDNIAQTWDRISQGGRLLTMSCLDKICRWNVLGLQGALLSHFVEPVYLKTVIVGNFFEKTKVDDAIGGTVGKSLQNLPQTFQLNRPGLIYLNFKSTGETTSDFLLNWCDGDVDPEIIDMKTGKPKTGTSKYCRQAFMKRFDRLVGNIPSISGIGKKYSRNSLYCDVKKSAIPYRVAKEIFYEAFNSFESEIWISKPVELDRFGVDD